LKRLKNHIKVAKELEMETFYDEWDIRETKYEIHGYTLMDNFDMEKFLLLIGVTREDVEWED
jgi:hypothetical protein